jgi:hypothetical protein
VRFFIGVASEVDEFPRGRLVIFGRQMQLPSKISEPLSIRRESRVQS